MPFREYVLRGVASAATPVEEGRVGKDRGRGGAQRGHTPNDLVRKTDWRRRSQLRQALQCQPSRPDEAVPQMPPCAHPPHEREQELLCADGRWHRRTLRLHPATLYTNATFVRRYSAILVVEGCRLKTRPCFCTDDHQHSRFDMGASRS